MTRKKIFTMRLSEDGINVNAFTNIKAIHNEILEFAKQESYVPVSISRYHRGLSDVKYSYKELVTAIRFAQKNRQFTVADIQCKRLCSIEINELNIVS